MTGIVGGPSNRVRNMCGNLYTEEWYETELSTVGSAGIGIAHHAEKDPKGHTYWTDGNRVGALHGAVTDDIDDDELFRTFFQDPEELLNSVNGSFLIAAADGDTGCRLVATDRLATRPCFWALVEGEPVFASESTPVVSEIDDPQVDRDTVAEFLALGRFTWGTKTLVEGVQTVPPATILEFDAGGLTTTRYWRPNFDPADSAFVDDAERAYRGVVERAVGTTDSDIGFRLTGGLDSRTLAETLSEHVDDAYSVTFDANPAGDINPRLAERVATRLPITNEPQRTDPDEFADIIDRSIRLSNGLIPWTRFYWFPFLYSELGDRIDVLVDAKGQGELLGEDIFLEDTRSSQSAAETLYRHWSGRSPEAVDEFVTFDAAPKTTMRRDVTATEHGDDYAGVMAHVFDNFYPNFHFRTSPPIRSQVGERYLFADEAFLDTVTRMPPQYRRRKLKIPFTDGKGLPHSLSEAKLRLADRMCRRTGDVPYERTGQPPTASLLRHDAALYRRKLRKWVNSEETLNSPLDGWYDEAATIREYVDDHLEAATEREFFDEAAVSSLRRDYLDGEASLGVVGAITTIESWLQQVID